MELGKKSVVILSGNDNGLVTWKIWYSRHGVAENSSHPGYYAVLTAQ